MRDSLTALAANDFDPDLAGVSLHDAAIVYRCSQWRRSEAAIVSEFSGRINGVALARAAALFKVARQFPGSRGDPDGRAQLFSVVAIRVTEALAKLTTDTVVEAVVALSNELKSSGIVKLGAKGTPVETISACSKFLWCAAPDLGVIYDERARSALAALGHVVAKGDYAGFVRAFRCELDRKASELDEVMPLLGSLAGRSWQRAKLLDFWLYSNGKLASG